MQQNCFKMAAIVSVFAFMVLLAVVVEGREWRFDTVKRVKRGYSPSGFGAQSEHSYGRSDEQNASVSRERLGCSEEQGGSYGSHELAYNRDGRSNENRRHRSYTKASATASAAAAAFKQDHATNL